MPYRAPVRVDFDRVPANDDRLGIYHNMSVPLSSTTKIVQHRRHRANVVRISAADAPSGTGYAVRTYVGRQVPAGNTNAGEWATAGWALRPLRFVHGELTIYWRRRAGQNTKGVLLRWPFGGWRDPNIPVGWNHEDDFGEWFDQVSHTGMAKFAADIRAHYKKNEAGDDAQIIMETIRTASAGVIDWRDWHEQKVINIPGQYNQFVDGQQVTSGVVFPRSGTYRLPESDIKFLLPVRAFLGVQGALLTDDGKTVGTTPREEAWIDTSHAIGREWYSDGGVIVNETPTVPSGLSIASGESPRLTWSASTDPEGGVVTYVVQIAPVTGGEAGTRGAWTDHVTQTTRTVNFGGLDVGWWDVRVAAQDSRGLAGRSGWSSHRRFERTAATATPAPSTVVTVRDSTGSILGTGGGTISAPMPLDTRVSLEGSSGTYTTVTIDPGDGSGAAYSGSSIPTDATPWNYTYESAGNFTLTATLTDGATNRSDEVQIVISITDISENPDVEPNTGLRFMRPGNKLTARDWNGLVRAVGHLYETTVPKHITGLDGSEVLRSGDLAGEEVLRWYETVDGSFYLGNGTSEPLLYRGPDNAPAPPPPPAASSPIKATLTPVTTQAGAVLTFTIPADLVVGDHVMVATTWRQTNSAVVTASLSGGITGEGGYATDKGTNGVGSSNLHITHRTYATQADVDAHKGQTLTITIGNGTAVVNAAGVGAVVANVNGRTGKILPNVSSFVGDHNVPGTIEPATPLPEVATTQTNQRVLCVLGGRGNNTGERILVWPAGVTNLSQTWAAGAATGENTVVVGIGHFEQPEPATLQDRIVNTGQLASIGAMYALLHP